MNILCQHEPTTKSLVVWSSRLDGDVMDVHGYSIFDRNSRLDIQSLLIKLDKALHFSWDHCFGREPG
jgi:hypothetical protein